MDTLVKSFLILTTVSIALFSAPAWSIQDPAGVRQEREKVRKEIQALSVEIKNAETQIEREKKQIKRIEKRLDQSRLRLKALVNDQKVQQAEIQALQEEKAALLEKLADTEQRLAEVIRNQHIRAEDNPTRTWLSGQPPGKAARERFWLEEIFQAEQELSDTQHEQAEQLELLNVQLTEKQNKLIETVSKLEQRQRELNSQREEQLALVSNLNKSLRAQERQKNRLIGDEKRLTTVIDNLKKSIEQARQRQNASKPAPQKLSTANKAEFSRLKGQLTLPAQGKIIGRFGEKREKEGGRSTWKGIFIKASSGEPVYAVASGRVVFAEWLRGFGEIIIIDHGDQYLSVYGNNETLLNSSGDFVKRGDKIAQVGNSSGTLSVGLYFELRHQGKPFNPLSWTPN